MTKILLKNLQVNDVINNIIIVGIFKVPTKEYTYLNPRYSNLYGCLCSVCNHTDVVKDPRTKFHCLCTKEEQLRKKLTKKEHNRLYGIWRGMGSRCNNTYDTSYKWYGARGITVHQDWYVFKNFKQWALNTGYDKELTLDRINNDGNYEPTNCRWATLREQANNTRNNRYYTFYDKTLTIAQWAREIGTNYWALYSRLQNKNWTVEKALTTPFRYCKRSNHGSDKRKHL